MVFVLTALFMFGVSYLFVEMIPVDLICKTQLSRMTIFVKLITFLYLADSVSQWGSILWQKLAHLFLQVVGPIKGAGALQVKTLRRNSLVAFLKLCVHSKMAMYCCK